VTLRLLCEFQDAMFRTYVRNAMFLTTFPYHFAEQVRATCPRDDLARVELDRSRPVANRLCDVRWLR
jgi:hypothetical protein